MRWALGDGQEHGDDPAYDAVEAGALYDLFRVMEQQVWSFVGRKANGLDPKALRVELYAEGVMGGAPVRHEMKCIRQSAGGSGHCIYGAAVSAARRPADYTARVIPGLECGAVPLEFGRILWQSKD